jgi:hypothetical protein
MSAYLQWLAPQLDQVRGELQARVEKRRNEAVKIPGIHPRTPGAIANLYCGFETFVQFCRESGALSEDETTKLLQRNWNGLIESAKIQKEYQAAVNPALRFVELLRSAILSGNAYVADTQGKFPENWSAWGWMERALDLTPHPRGTQIGWVDGNNLYVDDIAALKVVALHATDGNGVSCSSTTLRHRLRDAGMLASTDLDTKRETFTVRRSLQGARRDVLHFKAGTIIEQKPKLTEMKSIGGRRMAAASKPVNGAPTKRAFRR